MGFFSKLFGGKKTPEQTKQEYIDKNIVHVPNESERMAWAIEKANHTIDFFVDKMRNPRPNDSYFSIKVRLEHEGESEHLWLNNMSFDDSGNLFGELGNPPMYIPNLSIGQKIGVSNDAISDWMIINQGRLIGGYTIRAIRDGLPVAERPAFDQSVGGLLIDEGEDYFIPNQDTPEGAITALEEAYNNNDLDKAVSLKDFDIEARTMLSSMPKADQMTDEIVSKMAEVVKLGFIKSLQESGMPKFEGCKRAFTNREKVDTNHYIITEVIRYPDGSKSSQRLHTYRNNTGWVVGPPLD